MPSTIQRNTGRCVRGQVSVSDASLQGVPTWEPIYKFKAQRNALPARGRVKGVKGETSLLCGRTSCNSLKPSLK